MNHAFPRVYRAGRTGLMFQVGLAVTVIGMSIAGAVYFLLFSDDRPPGNAIFAVICTAFGALGAYTAFAVLRTRVVLEADAIELFGAFSSKRLRREDIAGRRLMPQQYGPPVIKLFPRHSSESALTLIQYLKTDAHFDAWFQKIPDLDEEEAQASLDAVLEDADVSGSREEKVAALERARRIAAGFRNATFAVCAWVWFYPHPYGLSVVCAALLPWAAVAVASRGGSLYRFNPKPNDVGADLSTPVILPGFALSVRAMLDSQILDWEKLLTLTIIATALCVLVLVWRVRELRASFALFGLLMVAYAYGVVALANFRLDSSEPEVYPVPVLGTHLGSGRHRSYYLSVGPWGPRKEPEDVDVGSDYYVRVRTSHLETVCVYVFRGALGARWFEVWDCPRG